MITARLDSEAALEVIDKLRGKSIGGLDGGDTSQAQFFDQAILQGLDGTLNSSFGLGCVSTNQIDV